MACHTRPGYTVARYACEIIIAHPMPYVKPYFYPSFLGCLIRPHPITEGLSRAFLGGFVMPLPLEERVFRPLTKLKFCMDRG